MEKQGFNLGDQSGLHSSIQNENNRKDNAELLSADEPVGFCWANRFAIGSVVLLCLTVPGSAEAEASPWQQIFQVLPGIAVSSPELDLTACEKASDIDYFAHAGCPGYLTDLRDMNVRSLQKSRAQVVLYLDGLITPLYSDKTFFVQGSGFMHALPPRLPVKLQMLKLRTPELIGLKLHDTFRVAESVVTPLLEAPTGDPIGQLRASMRKLGIDPLPTTVMPALGTHDSYLLQNWAAADPEGLADFLARVQAVVDQL